MWMCISICESAFRLVTNHLYISSDFCSKQCHKPYTFLQIRNMTASQYNPWFEFQSWMKVKVVKWCRKKKKWNEHNLMHIYHKQCEIMQKKSMKQLKRQTLLIYHWISVEMVQNEPKLCKHKCYRELKNPTSHQNF